MILVRKCKKYSPVGLHTLSAMTLAEWKNRWSDYLIEHRCRGVSDTQIKDRYILMR